MGLRPRVYEIAFVVWVFNRAKKMEEFGGGEEDCALETAKCTVEGGYGAAGW